jgi:hypothetical protein
MAPPPPGERIEVTRPRFSVVIPTRDRADTLRQALATCLDQEFDDYEILVCDNGSSAATRQVVDEAGSGRVRYLRAPRPLAMTDNWELGVSEARGEFMFVVGDDDGLMPYALRELDRLVTGRQAPIVRWEAGLYTWPDIDLPGQGDYLRVPLGRHLRTLHAKPTIASVLRFETPYVQLPTFYNSAIHRRLVEDLRGRVGRVFLGRYPDVYSGFALGHLSGLYLSTDVPMTVAGLSGQSTGIANLFRRGESRLDEDFRNLNDGAGLAAHRWVPDLPVFPEVPVADSFQQASQALFPDSVPPALDRRQLLAHCLAAVRPSNRDEDVAAIRATVADDAELGQWLEAALSAGAVAPRPPIKIRPDHFGFDGHCLHLDAASFDVSNIREAVGLAARILGFRRREIDYADCGNAS